MSAAGDLLRAADARDAVLVDRASRLDDRVAAPTMTEVRSPAMASFQR
jgi:hypothetical protein